ncbi:hypothetical protein GGI25_003070 [Coemansia spiralis]|uniref:DH domain-containing protein n=2 Tax=Coemansia TaxID=4863 RepID=A0A9W8G740_9FUNG|nr:hypothetical protein EDC05_001499 [Coemansia umbellata]KAJ2624388.1 hypothetical protein GGI26_001523 [Coemansia sp. RSA 1358]KAJ2677550.1 hypothetical protein GGI25_003070 [Coemansia spiralis]
MNAQKTSPLANIDPVALELLLSDRLQDPTPAVLRVCNFPTNFVPFEDMHPLQYMKQSQLHFISSNPIRPLADPPERKESNMHKQPAPPKSIRAKNNFYIESPPSKSHPEPITPALTSHRCLERTGDRHKYIIGELVLTEEAYVIDLDILASAFSMPLCNYARSKEMALDEMLNPLQKLILFQRQFLQHLHKAAAAANVFAVARLFASEASGFKIYMEYCSTYHQITNALDHFEFDPVWQKLLNNNQPQASNGSRKCRLSLRDLLIKPVQRICKYPLFLSELRKYTAKGSDPDTYAEIDHSLLLIKGICAGIDKEQQYGESLKLRRAILDSYCDNPTLPVSLVARLGTISLSGPLQICVCNTEKAKAIHLFGCVLFKRFLIILKAEKPKQLIPHFWFPMHNMALVDDNTECSWRLQHIKSNQHMRFGARSAQEKKVWVNKLKEVISVSVAKASMSYRRRCAVDTAQSPCLQPLESLQHPARHSNTPIKQKHTRGGWPPWQSSFSLAMEKTGKIEANFKAFTSPEIIRIATLERLKGNTPPPLKTKLTGRSKYFTEVAVPGGGPV